jgi:hypothetical protein
VRIDGKVFLLLLGLATLALAVLTLWLWPRLAGRGVKPVAGRIGLLLGTQLSLAATFLFTVNAVGGFYTSWGQLFGTASSRYALKDAGAPPVAAKDSLQVVPAPGGGQSRITGVRSGLSALLSVYTPANYAAKPEAGRTFPVEVVDLTAGIGGQQQPDYQKLADSYHVIVAVVAADSSAGSAGSAAGSASSAGGPVIPGVNVPDGPQGELFWSQDLRTALSAHYRVSTQAAQWGIAGVDEAGGTAVNLAVQDSSHYGLAAAVGAWTSGPPQDSFPGIDKYLAGAPAPAVRVLYNVTQNVPSKIQSSDGPLQVAPKNGLDLPTALNWLGSSIDATGAPA